MPRRDRRVILIVRLTGAHLRTPLTPVVKERIDWLAENVFPKEDFPERNLVIFGEISTLKLTAGLTHPWEVFGNAGNMCPDWQDLYNKLLNGGFFHPNALFTNEAEYFDFGLFLNVRGDGEPGLGYGRMECADERCILRALFLASQGNVLFGDWGFPDEMRTNRSDEELRTHYCRGAYTTDDAAKRFYPPVTHGDMPYKGIPFLEILNHYFPCPYRSISIKNPTLPKPIMNLIRDGTKGKLFDPKECKRVCWVAQWSMYFAVDSITLSQHRWKRFFNLQNNGYRHWSNLRTWFASNTWEEIAQDLAAFYFVGVCFGFVMLTVWSMILGKYSLVYEIFRLLIVGPFLFTVSFLCANFYFVPDFPAYERIPTHARLQQYLADADRLVKAFLPLALIWPWVDIMDLSRFLVWVVLMKHGWLIFCDKTMPIADIFLGWYLNLSFSTPVIALLVYGLLCHLSYSSYVERIMTTHRRHDRIWCTFYGLKGYFNVYEGRWYVQGIARVAKASLIFKLAPIIVEEALKHWRYQILSANGNADFHCKDMAPPLIQDLDSNTKCHDSWWTQSAILLCGTHKTSDRTPVAPND